MVEIEYYLRKKEEEYKKRKQEVWGKNLPHFAEEVERKLYIVREEFQDAWEAIKEKIEKNPEQSEAEKARKTVDIRQKERLEIQIKARIDTFYEVLNNCMK